MRRSWLLAAILVVMLTGCASSGINGRVLGGPPCPADAAVSCQPQGVKSVVLVSNDKGDPITTVQTDDSGVFQVALAPGTYILQPQRGSGQGPHDVGKPIVVKVEPGKYASAPLHFDTLN